MPNPIWTQVERDERLSPEVRTWAWRNRILLTVFWTSVWIGAAVVFGVTFVPVSLEWVLG